MQVQENLNNQRSHGDHYARGFQGQCQDPWEDSVGEGLQKRNLS